MRAECTDLFCMLPAKPAPPEVLEIPTTVVMAFYFRSLSNMGPKHV